MNGGDAGLQRFFERVHGALVPGGTFVFEAQPRESYIKARKLHPVRTIYPFILYIYLMHFPQHRRCRRMRRHCRYNRTVLREYCVLLGSTPRKGSVSLAKAVSI